jgi:response regulator RpfG family c-di-GMP phosphodiesterase
MYAGAQTGPGCRCIVSNDMLIEMPRRKLEHQGRLILVLEDEGETRTGIEKLLDTDGYAVDPACNEDDAVAKAACEHPDLM